jgi:hypothetical protein
MDLYQNARICAGTADSRAETILTARGQNCVQEESKLWPIKWNKISVVMHLVQAWVKARYLEIPMVYPEFNDMGLRSLERTFNEFQRQALEIDLEHAFKQFSSLLDQLQDNEHLKPSKSKGLDRNRLAGLRSRLFSTTPYYQQISTGLKHSGDWPEMLRHNWKAKQSYRVITLFCNNLSPQPVMPRGRVCSTW